MALRQLQPVLTRKRIAILEACVIGLVSGLAAVMLKQGVEALAEWRINHASPRWLLLPAMGLIGAFLSGWLVEKFAPQSASSGVPQVKAVLGYVPMPLNLRVACVKLLSTLLALGSGLSLGRQGPTVQIGAALAAQLSRWVPTSPEYRRQLIAAGAAAGLAAGFNAPISGVLFVVEELLQDFSGLTLGSAILASFIGAVVSRLLGGHGLNLSTETATIGLSLLDLPFLFVLGVLAGLLGAVFSEGIFETFKLFRRLKDWPLAARVALAGGVTGLIGVFVPVAAQDNTGLREFLVAGDADWRLIAIAFGFKFLLTLMAYGSGAAGGIFAPALVLGSAQGCLISFVAQAFYQGFGLDVVSPDLANSTTYALTGMGAFFAAVTRVPITAIVIVFEMTANFNLVLPLMIGSGVAYLISDRIANGSIYSRLLAWKGIHLEPTSQANNPWANLKASDLMVRRVETLSSQMTVQQTMQAFLESHHRGFPVVDGGRLVGIVTQSDLSDAPISSLDPKRRLADVMTPAPLTVSPEASLTEVLYLLNRHKISRLPVTEGKKLVGLITRGDIIRAESDQVSGLHSQSGMPIAPSYLVYQRREPATGRGRLLVPLSAPQTAPQLMTLACAIASAQNYELECLHIVQVPESIPPSEAPLQLEAAFALLDEATAIAHQASLTIHVQIRAAHAVGCTLLEVIKERHIDLLLMGWHRQTATPGRVMGPAVETVIRHALCTVMVVRLRTTSFRRWLIPTAGGPNSRTALELLPGLLTLGVLEDIRLCCVCLEESGIKQVREQVRAMARSLELSHHHRVRHHLLLSDSVASTVVNLSHKHRSDVILLGASREGLLSQMINGNVPLDITLQSDATVILIRKGAVGAEDSTV